LSRKPAPVRTLADVDRLVGEMTLDQKVGQCMTLAFYGTVVTNEAVELIEKLHCGGLRVTPHVNTSGSHDVVRRLAPYLTPAGYAGVLNELQEVAAARPLGLPLHMVTDQEGDLSVDYLHGGVNFFPSQMGLAAAGSPAFTRKCARAVARQLRAVGVHMIHSPVLDVNLNPANPEIGCRSFSNSPEVCAEQGRAFLRGLADGGVVATGKHFPGRGDSAVDAHHCLPRLEVSRARLDAVELLPYRRCIAGGLPAIMSAHNAYPALDDSGLPASISRKIVTGLLRGELGFDGVVTTDAMGMGGLLAICPTPEGCARAIEAGNDLVLVKDFKGVPEASFEAIKAFVQKGRIGAAQLDASVRRILAMKLAYRIFAERRVRPELAERAVRDPLTVALSRQAARRAMLVARDRDGLLPLSPKQRIMVLLPIRIEYHEKGNDAWCTPQWLYQAVRRYAPRAALVEFADPAGTGAVDHAVKRSGDFDVTVVFDHVWRGPATSHEMVRRLAAAGRRVVTVSNYAYDARFLPEAGTLVITHSAMPPSMDAAAALLFGRLKPAGRSPIEE
jgi:beta-N-acetylhexosaminidase